MNNDKPRLLIFHPALAPYRLDFFNALADRFTCHVVLLQRENPALFIKQDQLLAEARFTYAYLDRHFTLAGRDINLGYASAIRHFRPDIVLCSEFNLSVLSAALYRWRHPRRFRLFTMCDDSIAMAERCQGGRRRRRAALIRCLDGIVNISEETAAWFLRHTPARRTFSFPIIRAEQTFVCHRPTAARYVSTHQLAGMKVGLFVGRFVDVKNLPALLEAFRRVCERNAAAANYRSFSTRRERRASERLKSPSRRSRISRPRDLLRRLYGPGFMGLVCYGRLLGFMQQQRSLWRCRQ